MPDRELSEEGTARPYLLWLGAFAVSIAIFVFDLSLPLGVAGGVPYVALVLIGIFLPSAMQVYLLAIIGSVLTIIGYFMSPDGGIAWIVYTNRALAIFAIWITAILIASRRNYELALIASRHKAEAASQAKSDFLAHMSHEIRTPITGIFGLTELLAKTRLTVEQRDLLASTKSSARNLLSIINDILDQSRIEAGKLQIERLDFDLSVMTEELKSIFHQQAAEKNLKLTIDLDPALQGGVHGDPTRIRQVLINLLGNAIKFTDEGKIDASIVRVSGDRVRFTVTDTGSGVSNAAQARLFGNFEQADSSTSRRYGGSGLGLSISKNLVVLMGGEIGFESRPETGSTFWFELPLPSSGKPVERPAEPANLEACRPLSILIADDNEINLMIVDQLLSHFGHVCKTAMNGKEALEAVQRDRFDVVLMDIRMPEMDGIEAFRHIRELDGEAGVLPIVALTADVTDEHVRGYSEIGFNAVACKPIDIRELTTAIDESIGESVHSPRIV